MDHLTFLKKLPKTETHLHLEAALPYSFLQELDAEAFAALPASWDKNYRYESFDEFSKQVLLYAGTWFTSIERYRQAARATFAGLIEQNVRYLEVSVTSGILEYYKLDPRAVLAAVREEVPEELEVRLFMGIHHTGYTEAMGPLLDDSVSWPELDGYDLQGKEDVPVGDWAPGLWQRAREHGKFTKAHAGELCGPKFIRWVLDEMGVQRLEHGVRAIEDQALVRRLSEENIVLDVCPISNLKLRVVPSLSEHPVIALSEAGVRCTLSTDDPVAFGNTLTGEYVAMAEEGGVSLETLIGFARNGFHAALVEEDVRARWLDELEKAVKSL